MQQIILAFSKRETSEKIKRMLEDSEYEIFSVCTSKDELMRCVARSENALVIMSYKLPDGTVNDVCDDLPNGFSVMAIVKAEQQGYINDENVFVLPLPVNKINLTSSIERICMPVRKTKKKNVRTQEETKIINKAKLLLMEEHMMSEEQAHRFIQKRSMDTGMKFVDTARLILNI